MNKNSIAIALVAAVVSAQGNSENANGRDPKFVEWVAQNNKSFGSSSEMARREENFIASVNKVENLRKKYPNTQFAMNPYSDLDDEEWESMLGLDESRLGTRRLESKTDTGRQLQDAAPPINWLTTGHMGAVKDQGQCGSCWAFNSASVLEAKKSIVDSASDGSLVPPLRLSEQEAVDCSTAYGNGGCNGGWPSNYWDYVYDNGAVANSDYEYVARDQACKRTEEMEIKAEIYDWNWVDQNDQAIANALQEGPLSIATMVEGDGWRYYAGGVMPVDGCTTNSVNHAIVLVAYEAGEEQTIPGEDIWVPPTDDVWVPGDDDERVPESKDYCRRAKKRERRAGRCAGDLSVLNEAVTKCCKPGDEEQMIPGEEGYWEPGQEGYWMPGEDIVVSGDPVWVFQNSWGPYWGDNGMIRIPVEVGDGPGHCQVQAWVQNVDAI